jgi:signal transduction histidine kinase/ligand-binding sensor domain-containing protein/AraC-like DNA-binding protein
MLKWIKIFDLFFATFGQDLMHAYMIIHKVIFIFFATLFLGINMLSQSKRLFDSNEGLSNSLINQVFQDHLGFIWLATEDGLNRFDGIKFSAFGQNKNTAHALKANYVKALAEDKNGNLWVGLVNGLQIYNHATESFKEVEIFISDNKINPYISSIIQSANGDIWLSTSRYGLIKIDKNTGRPRISSDLNKKLVSNYLVCVFEDSKGLLWIGSDNHGLNSYNPKTGEIQTYKESLNGNYKIPSNIISAICEDNQGNIYVASIKGGLIRINSTTGNIEIIRSANPDENQLPVKNLLFDSKKRLWVGTDGRGLKLLNPNTNLLESYAPASTTFDFSKSKIHSIIEDNIGNIWLGIFQKGLYLLPSSQEIFVNYGYRAFGENSIGSSCITSIEGENHELWIGTDGDGLYKLNRQNNKVSHIRIKNPQNLLEGNNILALCNTPGDFIYIGTFLNGMVRLHKKKMNVKFFMNEHGNPKSLVNDKITVIKPYHNEQLLIGTLGGGICRFDTKKEIFLPGLDISDSLNALIPKWVNAIYIDNCNKYWIGTYDGLTEIDPKKNTFKLHTQSTGLLSNNVVYSIQPDTKGNLWVGTYEGLVKIDIQKNVSRTYSTKDGLGSNVICAIQEDEFGQIWISTHNGLSRYSPADDSFTNYFASDGLQANEFSRNATYKSKNNELFFGGINGISEIKRDYRNFTRTVRDVMLTEFIRFDKTVKIGEKSGKHIILSKSIVLADTVKLMERDNVFSISFTSVELANQSRISYEYKMEGFDANWNLSNPLARTATYTNLAHGTYHFYVRGIDKGQYSQPRKLTIIIYPPWYKTIWAKALWLAVFVMLFYGIILFYKEKLKRKESEKHNEMKMQFFINISHEIKTPLTLILDPLDKLLSRKTDEETSRLYQTMQLNSRRIFRLINQLLDLRKIDKGKFLVKFQNIRLFPFVKEVARSYELMAETKKIDFSIETADPNIEAWIDPLNFEKVILNLLSNAFKFTQEGGRVEVHISKEVPEGKMAKYGEMIRIAVSDNGIGLKKSEIEKIFTRFYQEYSNDRTNITGSGIGLHLSRSIIELHQGELYAENRSDGSGSRFIILLRPGSEHLSKEDLVIEENILPAPTNKMHPQALWGLVSPSGEKIRKPKTNYKIMVVEDESEIRNYLVYELSATYKVVGFENAKLAFEALMDERPDLILSDIMMPKMDGISFCKKIKGNSLTSHIPVVLLTALSREEDKAEGIETGADMYIAKPFNSDFLKKAIASILENRRKIYEQLQNADEQPLIEMEGMKSHDEILMQKVMTIIKENLSESGLNVEMLADGVGISRVHMHRKLKELTNQSARDFIRNVRMKQAAYLLVHKKMNISEVAYSVGYSNLSHFSNSFKSIYGVSPTEYIQKQHVSPANEKE